MTKFLAAVAAALLMSGCAVPPEQPGYIEVATKLQKGMTEAQVIAQMGQPAQRVQKGEKVALLWSTYREQVTLFFVDGKLYEPLKPQ